MARSEVDAAMAGIALAQRVLRAYADGDRRAAMAAIDTAPRVVLRWACATLAGSVNGALSLLARETGEDLAWLLRAGADGLDADVAIIGAAVVMEESKESKGWEVNG